MKKFNHLNVPQHWEHYWSKYPEGYTILEALLNWVRQVDDMVDNVNDWNEYLEDFVETFDEKLKPHVVEFLKEMEQDGRLAEIINEAIFGELNERLDNNDELYLNILNYTDHVVDGDWSPAIYAAMNDLPESGGTLGVPWQITIKNPIYVTKPVNFIGAGYGSNQHEEDRGKSTIIKDGFFDGITLMRNAISMQSLQLDGVEGNTGDGIVLAAARIHLLNVSVMNQGKDGVRVGTPEAHNVNLWRITNLVTIYNGRHGLYIHDGNEQRANANAGTLVGIDTRGNGGDGIKVENGMDNSYFGVSSQSNQGIGIRLASPARGNYFYNPYYELNGTDYNKEVLIEAGAIRNVIDGQPSVMAYRAITNEGGSSNRVNYTSVRMPEHPYYFESPTAFSNVLVNNDDISGYWSISQNDERDLDIELKGTGTSGDLKVNFKTATTGAFLVNLPDIAAETITFPNRVVLADFDTRTNTVNIGEIAAHYSKEYIYPFEGVQPGDNIVADIVSGSEGFNRGLVFNVFVSGEGSITLRISNISPSAIVGGSPIFRFTKLRVVR